MKKILISAKNLKIGGIEKSLITLIDYLTEHGYTVTLVLEKIEGELLKRLNLKTKVIEYRPCSMAFLPFRKCINYFKRVIFYFRLKNRFDVSISYATYSKVGSYTARIASKNSILWCHADYVSLFNGDKQKVKNFFEELKYSKFSKIVFVSKNAKKTFLEVFPEQENVFFCNNLVNIEEIKEKSEEIIELKKEKVPTFLNVARHDEHQKKISRIIEASKMLKEKNYDFKMLFVGNGQDTEYYKKQVKKYNLEKNIMFLGKKENPYPYFKITDCVILSSDYEGYPVVFLESYILNKPIITTKISDYEDIEKGRGIVVEKSNDSIYKAMKKFLEKGYEIKNKFDAQKYNKEIKNKLEEILEKF